MPTQPWIAHDHPERPLERGAWICGCRACEIALRASTAADPSLRLVAKTATGREVVSGPQSHPSTDDPGAEHWLEVFVA